MKRTTFTAVLVLCSLLPNVSAQPRERAGWKDPPEFKHLKYRSVGPSLGGRVSRVAGVPGDPLIYYAATASGGLWKSSDGGLNWESIFDDQPISSLGSIAVAASDPNVLYVGSGEANIRGNVAPGNGIYRSEDAGKTWKHVWKSSGQIGTMIVHPRNPAIAYAAVLGSAFGPNEERGVYRTTDGGKTWKRVLFRSKDAGASDVCMDPNNPRILFAGIWQTRRTPWSLTSGGPDSGLYFSRDAGDTWTELIPEAEKERPQTRKARGLPARPWGKIAVAIAPSNSRRVYALIEAEKGGLFRSDDGGESWELVNDSRALRQRAWYFTHLTIHPRNADVLWCPQVPLLKSIDAGKSFQRVKGLHHGDHHDLWIDPRNPERMIDANDGGVDITTNGGKTWYAPPLPIGQFYHIDVDNALPYRVMGTMQDLGTARGPSNSLTSDGIQLADWHWVGGGEAGHIAADPSDPNIVYAGEYSGYISRYDHRTRQAKPVSSYPYNASGHGGEQLRYRFQWTAPILISPHDPKTIYHAANVLFRTRDGGQSWEKISPDLTRNDKSKQKWSGGPITGDNTGVEIYCTIFAVAESPRQKGLIWVGSDDGLVHLTTDAGKTWQNVTPRGLPEWGTISCIEPSPFDPGTAHVVVDAHRLDDLKPYLFRTTDFGKTWQNLSADLPQDTYLRVVRCDPANRGLLYLGTERGLAFSRDDGKTWQPLRLNLPTVAVSDLKVKNGDLVVGTMGRGIWILDDLTPIRSFKPGEEKAALLPVREAIRWRTHYRPQVGGHGKAGENPPAGVILHYWLREKPKGEVKLVVRRDGKVLRTLSSKPVPEEKPTQDEGSYDEPPKPPKPLPAEPGLHRVIWDLRYEDAEIIKGAKLDGGNPKIGPLVPPGTCTITLLVDGLESTQEVKILPDPRLKIPAKEYEAQDRLAAEIRGQIGTLARLVHQLRAVKKQIQDRAELLREDERVGELLKAGSALVAKLDALEEQLHNPRAKVSYDILAQKGGARLYSQLAWLLEQLKDADGEPTQGLRELHRDFTQELKKHEETWKRLVAEDLARLNEQAKKLDVPTVVVPRSAAR